MFETPLVSIDWLQANIDMPELIILDATLQSITDTDNTDVTDFRCIPGALFFDIKHKFSDVSAPFPNALPSVEQFEKEAQALGVNTTSLVVVYDTKGIYSSARAWWLFRYFGMQNIAVLDGGLPEWIQRGYETHKAYATSISRGNFKASLQDASLFLDFEGINNAIAEGNSTLIDARSQLRFEGKVAEPRQGLRSGTIPNAVNLPYTKLLHHNTMKSREELVALFNTVVEHPSPLIFSCGSGITACHLALGATLAGYENLSVYDGSWTEYGTLTN